MSRRETGVLLSPMSGQWSVADNLTQSQAT
jgi:hypothetical protein